MFLNMSVDRIVFTCNKGVKLNMLKRIQSNLINPDSLVLKEIVWIKVHMKRSSEQIQIHTGIN